MVEEQVAAEVVPTDARHAGRAAKALQQRGFLVRHVAGSSVSVEAPRAAFETVFGVSFRTHTKTVHEESGRRATFLRAEPGSVRVPDDLAELIADVAFAEPPELY